MPYLNRLVVGVIKFIFLSGLFINEIDPRKLIENPVSKINLRRAQWSNYYNCATLG